MNKREFLKSCLLGMGSLCIQGKVYPMESPAGNDKNTKEGMFYSVTPKGVRCLICPNECNIREGEAGDCRSRINKNGKLYSIAYGNPCAVNIDPIEKKPLYHFYPGTTAFSIAAAGCSLACLNCQNWEISQKSPKETRNYDLLPDQVVASAIKSDCKTIAYTYSEPTTFYEYSYDTSVLARSKNVKNILKTSGYVNEEPLRKICKVVDAANVDLKSFSNEIYLKLNAGSLKPVLDSLKILKQEGVWLEITNLIVPSWNDDMVMIRKMCGWLAQNGLEYNPLHFSRFYPMHKLTQLPPTPVNIMTKAAEIARNEGLRFVYIGNVPGNESANTICPSCKKIVVERQGFTILKNNITGGACSFCKSVIPGVWN
jgi:pyruvate formate lyase activating enzyme